MSPEVDSRRGFLGPDSAAFRLPDYCPVWSTGLDPFPIPDTRYDRLTLSSFIVPGRDAFGNRRRGGGEQTAKS